MSGRSRSNDSSKIPGPNLYAYIGSYISLSSHSQIILRLSQVEIWSFGIFQGRQINALGFLCQNFLQLDLIPHSESEF